MSQNRAPSGVNSRFYISDEERANQPKVTKASLERILSYFKPSTGKLLLLLTIAATSFLTLFPSILTGKSSTVAAMVTKCSQIMPK